MTELHTEKYNIAWFKLAEFVARKEKERALGIYRLLSHSLDNKGLIYQLEGDLLHAFKDTKAIDAYKKACSYYEELGFYLEAALIYENLLDIHPHSLLFAYNTVKLYLKLENKPKIESALANLTHILIKYYQINEISTICQDETLSPKNRIIIYRYFVLHVLKHTDTPARHIYKYIEQILDSLFEIEDEQFKFISQLEQLNQDAYEHGFDYINSKIK